MNFLNIDCLSNLYFYVPSLDFPSLALTNKKLYNAFKCSNIFVNFYGNIVLTTQQQKLLNYMENKKQYLFNIQAPPCWGKTILILISAVHNYKNFSKTSLIVIPNDIILQYKKYINTIYANEIIKINNINIKNKISVITRNNILKFNRKTKTIFDDIYIDESHIPYNNIQLIINENSKSNSNFFLFSETENKRNFKKISSTNNFFIFDNVYDNTYIEPYLSTIQHNIIYTKVHKYNYIQNVDNIFIDIYKDYIKINYDTIYDMDGYKCGKREKDFNKIYLDAYIIYKLFTELKYEQNPDDTKRLLHKTHIPKNNIIHKQKYNLSITIDPVFEYPYPIENYYYFNNFIDEDFYIYNNNDITNKIFDIMKKINGPTILLTPKKMEPLMYKSKFHHRLFNLNEINFFCKQLNKLSNNIPTLKMQSLLVSYQNIDKISHFNGICNYIFIRPDLLTYNNYNKIINKIKTLKKNNIKIFNIILEHIDSQILLKTKLCDINFVREYIKLRNIKNIPDYPYINNIKIQYYKNEDFSIRETFMLFNKKLLKSKHNQTKNFIEIYNLFKNIDFQYLWNNILSK